MNFTASEIEEGEKLYSSLSKKDRGAFLFDIFGERGEDGHCYDLYYRYGCFPNKRKVVLVNFAIYGNAEEKQQLAWKLSRPDIWKTKTVEDFFALIYCWLNEETDPGIKKALTNGILFYPEKKEVRELVQYRLERDLSFANGVLSWLDLQPKWFREKHREFERQTWKKFQELWGSKLSDEHKTRNINKALSLPVNMDEIWFNEIENPWSFADKKIIELQKTGINIKLNREIGEFCMGGPMITELILNDVELEKSVGGPFITDPNNHFLCCTTFVRNKEGFALVLIDLRTNAITELDSSRTIYCPYKFKNGEFIVIVKKGKVDLDKDTLRYKLPETNTKC